MEGRNEDETSRDVRRGDSLRWVGSRTFINPSKDQTVPSVICQLTVESKGVPLADRLIASIFSADGRPLTRLSAAP